MLTVVHMTNLIGGRRIGEPVEIGWSGGETLAQLAPKGCNVCLVNDGKVVKFSDDEWSEPLADDQSLTFIELPRAEFWAAYGTYILWTLVVLNVIYQALTLFGVFSSSPSASGLGGEEEERESAAYGFDSVKNSLRNGAVRPVTYGRMRVGGQVLMAYRRADKNKSHILYMLLGLSEGPIARIGETDGTNYTSDQDELTGSGLPKGFQINDVEASDQEEISLSLRMGEDVQTVCPGFEENVIEYNTNFQLDGDEMTYETADFVNGIEVNLEFPGGLYRLDKGRMRIASMKITVDIFAIDGITLITTEDFKSLGQRRGSALYYSYRIGNLPTARYQVRIRRRSPRPPGWKQTDPEDQYWDQARVISILEIQDLPVTYTGMALAAIQVRASERLQGQFPTMTFVIDGKKVHTPDSVSETDLLFTRNPAWIMEDVFINKVLGGGHSIERSQIDDGVGGSFETYADINDTLIPAFTGAPEATINVFDFADLNGSGDTITLVVNTTTFNFVEGVDWAAVTDNDTTATNIAAAIALTAGINATAEANVATIKMDTGFNFTGDDPATTDSAASDMSVVLNAERRFEFNGTFDRARPIWDAAREVGAMSRASPFKAGALFKVSIETTKAATQMLTMGTAEEGTIEKTYINTKARANVYSVKFRNAAKNWYQDHASAELEGLDETAGQVRTKEFESIGCTSSTQARRLAFYLLRVEQMTPRSFKGDGGKKLLVAEPGDVVRISDDVLSFGKSGRIVSNAGGTVTLDRTITFTADRIYQYTEQLADDTMQSVEFTMPAGDSDTIAASKLTGMTATRGLNYIVSEKRTNPQSMFVTKVESTDGGLGRRLTGIEYLPEIYGDDAEPKEDTSFLPNLGAAPNIATNVRVTAESSTKNGISIITVEWDAAGTPPAPSGYAVYFRNNSDGAYAFVGSTAGLSHQFDLELAHGVIATFLVQTRLEDGQFTPIANAPTVDYVIKRKDNGKTLPVIPEDVTGLTLAPVSNNDVDIFWTAVTLEAVYADGFGTTPQVTPQAIVVDKYEIRAGTWNEGPVIYNKTAAAETGNRFALKTCAVPRTYVVRAKEDSFFSASAARVTSVAALPAAFPTEMIDHEFELGEVGVHFSQETVPEDLARFHTTGRLDNMTEVDWEDGGKALLQINKEVRCEYLTGFFDLGDTAALTFVSFNIEVLPYYLLHSFDDDLSGAAKHIGPHGRLKENYLDWKLWLEHTSNATPDADTNWTRYRIDNKMNQDVTRTFRYCRFRFQSDALRIIDPNFEEEAGRKRFASTLLRKLHIALHRA